MTPEGSQPLGLPVNLFGGVHDPEGVAAISPGSRGSASAPGEIDRPKVPTPEGVAAGRCCDPSGVDPICNCDCDRWYRCAQPPANGCDPSGVKTGNRLRRPCHRKCTSEYYLSQLAPRTLATSARRLDNRRKVPEPPHDH